MNKLEITERHIYRFTQISRESCYNIVCEGKRANWTTYCKKTKRYKKCGIRGWNGQCANNFDADCLSWLSLYYHMVTLFIGIGGYLLRLQCNMV